MVLMAPVFLYARHTRRGGHCGDDGGEYGNDELDDGLPGFHVFENFHINKFICILGCASAKSKLSAFGLHENS
jgi:hypothetical protein